MTEDEISDKLYDYVDRMLARVDRDTNNLTQICPEHSVMGGPVALVEFELYKNVIQNWIGYLDSITDEPEVQASAQALISHYRYLINELDNFLQSLQHHKFNKKEYRAFKDELKAYDEEGYDLLLYIEHILQLKKCETRIDEHFRGHPEMRQGFVMTLEL